MEDLLPLKTERFVAPKPPTFSSIPALLSAFQNEWDAVALERFSLKEQLMRTREELATALYQLDGATRVIERLSRERDEAREALSKITVSAGAASSEAMAVDNEALPDALVATVEETQAKLSKSRKKRPIPEGWVTSEEVSSFKPTTSDVLVPKASSASVEGSYAAISGFEGDVAIFSVEANVVERTLKVDEPVTDTLWVGGKTLFFATTKGSVKMFDSGSEVASFSEHAGPATAISMHPSGQILASVGTDKSIVFYNMADVSRASRIYTDSGKQCHTVVITTSHPITNIVLCSHYHRNIPPRRPYLRCRYLIRGNKTSYDQHGRASSLFLPWRADHCRRFLRERFLLRSYCQGTEHSYHL